MSSSCEGEIILEVDEHKPTTAAGGITLASLHQRHPMRLLPANRSKLPDTALLPREREAKEWGKRFKAVLPISDWLPRYGRDCGIHKSMRAPEMSDSEAVKDGLRRDLVAGMVIGIMLVPQVRAARPPLSLLLLIKQSPPCEFNSFLRLHIFHSACYGLCC